MEEDKKILQKAAFVFKPICLEELKLPFEHYLPFIVRRLLEITPEQFEGIGNHLQKQYRFLFDNKDAMFFDGNRQRMECILLTTPERKEGILLDAEGYAYAHYAAYVPDCRQLDLSKVPVIKQLDLSSNLPREYWRIHSEKKAQGKKEEGR